MYSILLDVASKHILHIACLTAMPINQVQSEPVFFNILTSVQHTSTIFDKLATKIPMLLKALKNNVALRQRLVDTVKALIDHFNTFPDHQNYSELVSDFLSSLVFESYGLLILPPLLLLLSLLGVHYIKGLHGIE